MGEELRQEFLKDTIHNLEVLQSELQSQFSEIISENLLRRLFRCLHTIKGTAQTFSFEKISRLAHEVENLLQAIQTNKLTQNSETSKIFKDSLTLLLELCRDDNFSVSEDFFTQLNNLIPPSDRNTLTGNLEEKIPKTLLSKLSTQETDNLRAALERGSLFYLLEVFFDLSSFNIDFIAIREALSKKGEIIAVSPSDKTSSSKEIGFRLYYVTDLRQSRVKEIIQPYAANIDFETDSIKKNSVDLTGILSNLIADCEKKARILDKKVLFEVSNEISNVARENLILINYALLHILRNAIDHAIETPEERLTVNKTAAGKIKLRIFQNEDELVLRIEDDGRGISEKNIVAQAEKHGLIGANQKLTIDETIHLIFAPGFSTSNSISGISGRGIGLDAVNDLIKKAGGRIKVDTRVGCGTTFEIYLPH